MQFTPEHAEIRRTVRAIVEKDVNPNVDKWEEDGIFPAHEVFKKLGNAGLLGISKPEEYGGMGLDYSYAMVVAEELGHLIAARSRWRSACRPTWPRRRSRARAPTNSQGIPRARDCRRLGRLLGVSEVGPAPTSPRSRPPRRKTAATR